MWKLKPQVKLQRPEFPPGGAWRNKSGKRWRYSEGWMEQREENRPRRETHRVRKGRKKKKKMICFLLVIHIVSTETHFRELCWQRGEKNWGQFDVPDNCLHTPGREEEKRKENSVWIKSAAGSKLRRLVLIFIFIFFTPRFYSHSIFSTAVNSGKKCCKHFISFIFRKRKIVWTEVNGNFFFFNSKCLLWREIFIRSPSCYLTYLLVQTAFFFRERLSVWEVMRWTVVAPDFCIFFFCLYHRKGVFLALL